MSDVVERVVKHPKLTLMVDGQLQRVSVGTKVKLSAKDAERLADKLEDPKAVKEVDATGKADAAAAHMAAIEKATGKK